MKNERELQNILKTLVTAHEHEVEEMRKIRKELHKMNEILGNGGV